MTLSIRTLLVGAALGALSPCAQAQTVGELLDKGAQKLDGAAARAVVAGVALAGTNAAGFSGQTEYKPDGTLYSSGSRNGITNFGTGTWSVDDSGKVCSKIQWNGGGTGGGCHIWLKQGEEYYTAQSDARDQKAIKRDVKK